MPLESSNKREIEQNPISVSIMEFPLTKFHSPFFQSKEIFFTFSCLTFASMKCANKQHFESKVWDPAGNNVLLSERLFDVLRIKTRVLVTVRNQPENQSYFHKHVSRISRKKKQLNIFSVLSSKSNCSFSLPISAFRLEFHIELSINTTKM